MTGTIKSFSPTHGFGFIECGNKDVYFHRKDWLNASDPAVGKEVEFQIRDTPKGYRGFKVHRI